MNEVNPFRWWGCIDEAGMHQDNLLPKICHCSEGKLGGEGVGRQILIHIISQTWTCQKPARMRDEGFGCKCDLDAANLQWARLRAAHAGMT